MANQELGFVDLLKKSWKEFSVSWKFIAKTYLYGFSLGLVVFLVAAAVFALFYFLVPKPLGYILIGIGLIPTIVASVYVGTWVNITLLKASVSASEGKVVPIKELFVGTRGLVGAFFVMTLFHGLFVWAGIFGFLVMSIIFGLWLSFSQYAFLVDGKRGVEALIFSREYTKGNLGKIFLYGLGLGLMFEILLGAVPGYIFEQLDVEFLSFFLNIVVGFVSGPLTLIFFYNLYKTLKSDKGKLEIDYSAARKRKYYAMMALPIVAFVLLVIFGISFLSSLPPIHEMLPKGM